MIKKIVLAGIIYFAGGMIFVASDAQPGNLEVSESSSNNKDYSFLKKFRSNFDNSGSIDDFMAQKIFEEGTAQGASSENKKLWEALKANHLQSRGIEVNSGFFDHFIAYVLNPSSGAEKTLLKPFLKAGDNQSKVEKATQIALLIAVLGTAIFAKGIFNAMSKQAGRWSEQFMTKAFASAMQRIKYGSSYQVPTSRISRWQTILRQYQASIAKYARESSGSAAAASAIDFRGLSRGHNGGAFSLGGADKEIIDLEKQEKKKVEDPTIVRVTNQRIVPLKNEISRCAALVASDNDISGRLYSVLNCLNELTKTINESGEDLLKKVGDVTIWCDTGIDLLDELNSFLNPDSMSEFSGRSKSSSTFGGGRGYGSSGGLF